MKLLRSPSDRSLGDVPSRRVLALIGDSQVGLWVVRSLGRSGVKVLAVCASPRGLAVRSRFAAGAWALDHGPRSPRFVEEIRELADQFKVGAVMTIAEDYHEAIIRSRHLLEPSVHVFSPQQECWEKATDKDFMHALCLKLGVPVARGSTLDAVMAGANLGLRFPLVLRTRRQIGPNGRTAPWKAAYARSEEHLRRLYEQVEDIASNVLVQEYHPGVEDHVQILMHKGEPFMVGEYIGEHHMPLAGGVTVQRVSCRHENLIRDAVKLLQAIGWEGVAGAQFHYDTATDRYIFLEINPRFIGGLPTVIRAGFDAPFLLWQSHFEPERMKKGVYRLGVRTRILGGDANWMLAQTRRDPLPPDQIHLSRFGAVCRFLWNCGPWTKDDTFWWRDIRPAWVDFKNMVSHLGDRTHDIIGNPAEGPAEGNSVK